MEEIFKRNNNINTNTLSCQNGNTPSNLSSSNEKNQKKWSTEEDQLLLTLIDSYKDKKIKWQDVSSHFMEKSTRQCYSRYRQINPQLNRGAWTPKEDKDLKYYFQKYGKKWSLIAKIIKTRSSKQIRDRYLNCLDDKVSKKSFTDSEDRKILELIYIHGSNWAKIAKEFEGRTGDNIKNRFNWSIKHTLTTPIDFKKISK